MAAEDRNPPREPILDGEQIQGNVVPGFMKPFMAVLALTIDDVAKTKTWLGDIAPTVTTLAQSMTSRVEVRKRRVLGPARLEQLGKLPDGVDDAWTNMGVSASGLSKLLAGGPHARDLAAFTDAGFQAGLARRSPLLGDPTDPSAEGNPANWVIGAPGDAPDVLGSWARTAPRSAHGCWSRCESTPSPAG
jgi:hypothetical protein